MKITVEKIEFTLSNGIVMLWRRENRGWCITKYVHGEEHKSTVGSGGLTPNMVNAIYWSGRL